MKPVFKCDYCKFMGTEEEVKKHENDCQDNYDRKSCYTCTHRITNFTDGIPTFECKMKINIPKGKIIAFCDSYERKDKSDNPLTELFENLFGGR